MFAAREGLEDGAHVEQVVTGLGIQCAVGSAVGALASVIYPSMK